MCYGCLPDLAGGRTSKDLAVSITANISRTWDGRSEGSFGKCSEMSLDPKFQVICNTNDRLTVCAEITNGNTFVSYFYNPIIKSIFTYTLL